MQITLVQAEIEAAITNFVTSQVNIRAEMRIDVDLSATRGANGFTATIDIVHKNSPRKDGQKAIAVSLVPDEPTKQDPVVTVLVEKPANPVAAVSEQEQQETLPEKTEEAATPAPVVNPLAVAPERPRSLFAGLQKPTNPS